MSCCSETSAEVVKDLVCGMQVDPAKAAGQSQYQGLTFLFCSLGCKKKFDLNPAQYMQSGKEMPPPQPQSGAAPAAASATKVAKYTCPRHSEVQADNPGSCPKCGMALEPVDLSATTARVEYTCPMHPQIATGQQCLRHTWLRPVNTSGDRRRSQRKNSLVQFASRYAAKLHRRKYLFMTNASLSCGREQ